MDKLKNAYIDYLLTEGKRPHSVYTFMKNLGSDEKEFYDHYSSFAQLESQIWAHLFSETVQSITADAAYQEFSARDKVLTLYYALVEKLKAKRSFVVFGLQHKGGWPLRAWGPLNELQKAFKEHVKQIVNDGVYSGEIADRPLLTDRYADALWLQMLFVLRFWASDHSPAFERTDAAIEKSVNLAFDLLGRNIADSTFDFAKFIFASKA